MASLKVVRLGGLLCILVFSAFTAQGQCGNQLLLNTWNQKGSTGNGNWTVAADGLSVFQSVNGNPTFFVSPDSLINTTIRGGFIRDSALEKLVPYNDE